MFILTDFSPVVSVSPASLPSDDLRLFYSTFNLSSMDSLPTKATPQFIILKLAIFDLEKKREGIRQKIIVGTVFYLVWKFNPCTVASAIAIAIAMQRADLNYRAVATIS